MSHLIFDIGNTRTKLAVINDANLLCVNAVDTLDADLIASLCRHYHVDAAIASVVGPQPDFGSLLPASLSARFHQLSYRSRLPITLDYETPETLGMDRVAAAVGARQLSGNHDPLLIVDAGSCITVDLLDSDDVFRGGAIAPGLRMRFRALHDYTASLPLLLHDDKPLTPSALPPLSGRNTRDSILSGVLNASLFEIQGFIQSYQCTYHSLKLFLTGGDAVFFAERLFFPKFANPNLVYIGLDKILEMNI